MKDIYEVDQECAEFLAFKEEHETELVKEATQHGVLLASSFLREKCLQLMFKVSQLQKEISGYASDQEVVLNGAYGNENKVVNQLSHILQSVKVEGQVVE